MSQGLAGNAAHYCRITYTGPAKAVRASLCVFEGGGCKAISQAR